LNSACPPFPSGRRTRKQKRRGVSPAFGYSLLTLPAEPQEKELEVKLQSKLDLPRSLCTCNPAHVWTHPCFWGIEGGCVSKVNKLRTELKPVPFSQEEVLLELGCVLPGTSRVN